jgi:N6-adenosine-specific RNA methylase IME4
MLPPLTLDPLTPAERAELARHEALIAGGRQTFVVVGAALLAIREQRLYREWGTFEAYCRRRFGFRRRHAYRLMAAASVIQKLSMGPIGHIPVNEAQVRPLTLLPSPTEQLAAWQEVIDAAQGAGITAAQVRAVVDRRRLIHERRSAHAVIPPLPPGRYTVILADPPWQYESVRDLARAIENHYPTLPLERICQLPVGEIAAPDCVLFLWATSPMLPAALEVVRTWGFTYRTSLVWVKDRLGLGFWARICHELLLIAVRGQPRCPAPALRPVSVIQAPRGRHSEKPEVVRELIERMFPEAARLELFCRRARRHWTVWGNEVEPADCP